VGSRNAEGGIERSGKSEWGSGNRREVGRRNVEFGLNEIATWLLVPIY